MPLRDHFELSTEDTAAWQEVHAMWPAVMVQHLFRILPKGYVAAPRVQIGKEMEIDLAALERGGAAHSATSDHQKGNGAGAIAVAAPPFPILEFETEWPDQDEFEVRIYETSRGRRLVAALELVSPGNKDCPENRRIFVAKCATLLQNGVSVSLIDLVTSRHFNMCHDLMEMIGRTDTIFAAEPPSIYAATCRAYRRGRGSKFAMWARPLAVGNELPQLPIWLTENQSIALDLEASYEETCTFLVVQ